MRRFLYLLLASTLTLGAAETPSPEKLLPGDTLFVLTVPNYAGAKTRWNQWGYMQLWEDSAIKPFREKLMTKVKSDVIDPLEREFGIKFADYKGLIQGQLTIAVTQGGKDEKGEQASAFLLLADTKDKKEALQSNLTKLKKTWTDSGKQSKTEKIRDVEFTTLMFSSDDLSKTLDKVFPDPDEGLETLEDPKPKGEKKPARKLEWLIGQSDSLLIIGSSAKDVERVLVRQSGGDAPSLGEQASFSSSYSSMFREAPAYAWLNTKAIIANLTKKKDTEEPAEKQPGMFPSMDKVLNALGLASLESIAANMADSRDGCAFTLHARIPESQRRGIFKIIMPEAKPAEPPSFVPADVVKFTRVRLDLQKAFATLEATLTEMNPQIAGILKMFFDSAGKDKDASFDIRKSLIGNLGDDIITYKKAPKAQTLAELNAPPTLYLLGSARAEQLASSFRAVTSLMPQQGKFKEREFLGRKVYSLNLPSQRPADGGRPVERTLSYAASGGYVALSTDTAMLEEFLRGNVSKPLREVSGLMEAAEKVGGMSTGFFSYENQSESIRATLETLKKESGSVANLLSNSALAGRLGMNDNSKTFKEWFDFSLLPSYDKISKYFHFGVSAASVNSDGVSVKAYAPTPPQLKK